MSLVGSPGALAPLYANQNGYNTTSSTSLTIAKEVKVLNIEGHKGFGIGNSVKIYNSEDVWMFGDVESHDPVEGMLTVDVKATSGFGTFANWSISLSGPQGPKGDTGAGGGVGNTGSVVVTTSATLSTSTSSVLAIPSDLGCYITLPVGTSVPTTGATIFNITNDGEFDLGIKDASGKKLGWLRAKTGSVVGCVDNTTVAGVWNINNLRPFAVTAHNYSANYPTSDSRSYKLDLDNDKEVIVYGLVPKVVIYDKINKTFTHYTPATSITAMQHAVIGTSGNQVLIAGIHNDDYTMTVCALTINPDNSVIFTSTIIDNPNDVGYYYPAFGSPANTRFINIMLHKVASNKFIISYSTQETTNRLMARVVQIDAITHAITISASNIVLATSTVDWMYRRIFSLSDNVFVMVYTIAGNVTWSSYTISSLSITTTTFETQKVVTPNPLLLKVFDRKDNKIVFICSNGTTYSLGVFNVGSTGLATSAASFTATALPISATPTSIDYMPIGTDLACLMTTLVSNPIIQLVNYTTGSIVVGNSVTIPIAATASGSCILSGDTTKIRALAYGTLVNLSVTGTTLAVTNISILPYNASGFIVGSSIGYYGLRDANMVFDENVSYPITSGCSLSRNINVIYGAKSLIPTELITSAYFTSIKNKENTKTVWTFCLGNILERLEFV